MNHQPSTPASGGAALAAPPEAPRSMNTSLSSTVKTADWKAEKHVPVIAVPGTLHATAYCNLHGLWTSAAPIAVK